MRTNQLNCYLWSYRIWRFFWSDASYLYRWVWCKHSISRALIQIMNISKNKSDSLPLAFDVYECKMTEAAFFFLAATTATATPKRLFQKTFCHILSPIYTHTLAPFPYYFFPSFLFFYVYLVFQQWSLKIRKYIHKWNWRGRKKAFYLTTSSLFMHQGRRKWKLWIKLFADISQPIIFFSSSLYSFSLHFCLFADVKVSRTPREKTTTESTFSLIQNDLQTLLNNGCAFAWYFHALVCECVVVVVAYYCFCFFGYLIKIAV